MAGNSVSLRILVKLPAASAVLGSFAICSMLGAAAISDPLEKRRFWVRNSQRHAKALAWICGLRIRVRVLQSTCRCEPALWVANHLSYVDVITLAAVQPSVFITSIEVRDTFFLGHMARWAGCVFIERRNRGGIEREIAEVAGLLEDGFTVVLFPEGTSSDGSAVLPFKRSFFRAATESVTPVQPVAIQYRSINGEALTPRNRDSVFYYGDLIFGPQFLRFLSLRYVDVEVILAHRLEPEQDSGFLAEQSHGLITGLYEPVNEPVKSGINSFFAE